MTEAPPPSGNSSVCGRIKHVLELPPAAGELNSEPDHWKNRDLIPLPPNRRIWKDVDFIGLWSTVFLTTFGWQATASLLALGLNIWQAVLCNFIARLFQVVFVLSMGWPGGVWHIGYSVSSRYAFGVFGGFVPLVLRIGLCTVWYGVQAFTGGQLLGVILSTIFPTYHNMKNTLPASASMTTKQFVGYVIYNIIVLPLLYIQPEKLRKPFRYTMILSGLSIIGLSVGLLAGAKGPGDLASIASNSAHGSKLGWGFVQGISVILGSGVVGMSSQSDFSRFARRPGDQVLGQTLAVMVFGNIVPVLGLLGTAAASKMYGDVAELGLWNPPNILELWLDQQYDNPKIRAAAFFAAVGFLASIIALNSIENGVSGGMDVAGLAPKYISIRRGSYILAALSVVIQPWQIIAKASVFTSVISSFGSILFPLMGVFTADYFLIRSKKLKLEDLYTANSDSIYWFNGGFNWRSFAAWTLGFGFSVPGLVAVDPKYTDIIPAGFLHFFYLSFIAGYLISFTTHWLFSTVFQPRGLGETDRLDSFGTFTPDEAEKLGIEIPLASEQTSFDETVGKEASETHSSVIV
ncbi:Uncharacterized protein BP5553_10036 [Venustampulla echinocandica]|uniref:Uncharacterized protein n=1 Tax=Venustampulla echinocandica TaxID=2656787 RepID=A0A370TA85_9HELO|nr:Uncharacterized protein BP5553_10036 [Venustampulla echinocandica]RDL30691.1 Uncharacterized protein BP5553_10036 [Venustampulla echinocandica]